MNKDWLIAWFQLQQGNLQWAKGQAWNGVQWTILLIAACFAGSTQYSAVPSWAWTAGLWSVALVSSWWQWDLYRFAKIARESSELLLEDLPERAYYLPRRLKDIHHNRLLLVRLGIIWGFAVATLWQLSHQGVGQGVR